MDRVTGRRLAGALGALLLALAGASPARAHGGVVGTQDFLQDYGTMLFLLVVVLLGAGVVAWVLRTPDTADADTADDTLD